MNNTQNGPSMPPVPHFVRAEMLPSGYLIRPCEGGGSIIHIVDHVDLEVSSKAETYFYLMYPKFAKETNKKCRHFISIQINHLLQ